VYRVAGDGRFDVLHEFTPDGVEYYGIYAGIMFASDG